MPILINFGSWLLGGLLAIAPTLAGQVLLSLGIGVVTYTGLSTAIDWLKSGVVTAFLGLPSQVVNMLSLMQVGSCISMIFSAMVIRMTIQGINGPTFKRWIKK